MRGVKLSMRSNYGEGAIGYVKLLREGAICTVEGKVCPEHRVHNKSYDVQVIVNEEEEIVLKAECKDCAAAKGGCKHTVVLLAWIYRRSEGPSPTSVTCYWKKSVLSSVGSIIKYQKINDIATKSKTNAKEENPINKNIVMNNFLASVLNHSDASKCNAHIVQFFKPSNVQMLSLHYLAGSFSGNKNNIQDFLDFCAENMSADYCRKASNVTRDQSISMLWYELRYGRITASTFYEAAQCSIFEGSLVEKILSMKNIDTPAMKRGRELEGQVLSIVEKHLKQKSNEQVFRCGLLLKKEYPALGASPDGITNTAVIEVKRPSKEKTVSRFCVNGKIKKKYRAQLHLQMLFAEKNIGYFCVADPNFENNKTITIIQESFDKNFTMAIIKRVMEFWKKAIFNNIMIINNSLLSTSTNQIYLFKMPTFRTLHICAPFQGYKKITI